MRDYLVEFPRKVIEDKTPIENVSIIKQKQQLMRLKHIAVLHTGGYSSPNSIYNLVREQKHICLGLIEEHWVSEPKSCSEY